MMLRTMTWRDLIPFLLFPYSLLMSWSIQKMNGLCSSICMHGSINNNKNHVDFPMQAHMP